MACIYETMQLFGTTYFAAYLPLNVEARLNIKYMKRAFKDYVRGKDFFVKKLLNWCFLKNGFYFEKINRGQHKLHDI